MKRDKDSQTRSLFEQLLPTADFKVEGALLELKDIIPPDDATMPDTNFVRSVQEFGVIQPILVERKGKKYRVRAGRRRFLAMLACSSQKQEWKDYRAEVLKLDSAAHEPFIPAGVVSGLPEAASGALLTLIENGMRSSNMQSECDAIVELIERGLTEAEITRATGISSAEIKQRLRLRELDPYLRELLSRGKIAESLAVAAAKLPAPLQKKLVATAKKRMAQDEGIKRALKNDDLRDVKQVRAEKATGALDGAQSELFIDSIEDSDRGLEGGAADEEYRLRDWKPRARFHVNELMRLLGVQPGSETLEGANEEALGLVGLVTQADAFLHELELAAAEPERYEDSPAEGAESGVPGLDKVVAQSPAAEPEGKASRQRARKSSSKKAAGKLGSRKSKKGAGVEKQP